MIINGILTNNSNIVSIIYRTFLAALVYKAFLRPAHNPFCGTTMTKQYTVCEALDHIFDHDTGEEERGQETDSEVVCDI